MKIKRFEQFVNEANLSDEVLKIKKGDNEQEQALPITDDVLQSESEQSCDNPHCEDGIVDRDMYGHPIYCQVCNSRN